MERRSALIAKDLQQCNIDAVALAEIRLHGKGDLVEIYWVSFVLGW